ncbi:GTP cyclohydrolase II [Helicobacter muridarum]|uniref:GTP cyclohydrolase-2 n=1 Tax=Helicobacter muridarum TaxID=216 RepID=A0A099TY28_9HELI|nr:GTP cyclohydrolase II [Helicobacter muridarum]TLE00456.1 GTP cyclohydrolase II [Helicobacter muridarum]STQ86430.1 GTP cyclohydrolase II [Helicobacter muridarum]
MNIKISNQAKLPTRFGNFQTKAFREFKDQQNIQEHLVVFTDPLPSIPLVRVHSECLTGDVFGSRKCDCGPELSFAMKEIYEQGGMLIYLRQEGRGIGLFNKINAYHLQDGGMDTVEANEALGFDKDMRNYDVVGEIFKHFNISEIRLLTNNPRKIEQMEKYAKCVRDSIIIEPNEYNKEYLMVKKHKLGHLL